MKYNKRLIACFIFTISIIVWNIQAQKPIYFKNKLPIFSQTLDSLGLKGSIIIYDLHADIYYSNDSIYNAIKFLPASTFKILNAMLAIELGIVKDTNRIFKWHGEKYPVKAWEKDMNFKAAFHASCVPCFQQIAREIGILNMKKYLSLAQYPIPIINAKNLDNFWLNGKGFISINDQIAWFKKFYLRQLPFKNSTYDLMHVILQYEAESTTYTLKAKTGLVHNGLGWFVGIIESKTPYIFALNLQTKTSEYAANLVNYRKILALLAFKELGFIE